jgi:hypothetical protein
MQASDANDDQNKKAKDKRRKFFDLEINLKEFSFHKT